MGQSRTLGALAGMAAACAMAASPAAAAELPAPSPVSATFSADPAFDIFKPGAETAEHHRWRRYRGYRGYRRHRGVDAGDVVAGVLILGGIAAIANAASKKNDRRYRDRDYDYRDRDYRNRDRNYRDDRRGDRRYDGGPGIDNAVSQCVSQIERDVRVDAVDSVDRTGEGWLVQGALFNGDRFTCRIGNDGRVSEIDFGGGFSGASADGAADGQWSDDRYAEARRTRGEAQPDVAYRAQMVRPTPEPSAQPAYPGGPLPGETLDERVDGDIGG